MVSMGISVDDASAGMYDGGADVLLMGTGSTFTTRRLAHPLLAINHPLLSRLLSHPGKRDQEAPRTARVPHTFAEMPHQLQQRTSGYASTRSTPQRIAHLWTTAKRGKSYSQYGR